MDKNAPRYYPLLAACLSLLSGILFALALHPHGFSYVGWVAFFPLLIAARISRPIIAAGCGMLAGALTGWILGGHLNTAGQYANLVAGFGSLALVLGFVSAAASLGAKRLAPATWAIFVACAGVTGEYIGTFLFPVSVAISQHANPSALHIAAFTGIWGVTFFIWLIPALLITLRRARQYALITLLASGVIIGSAHLPPSLSSGKTLTVAAIQAPDIENAGEQTLLLTPPAKIIVWPELLSHKQLAQSKTAAVDSNAYVVASFIDWRASKEYNAACLISPRGRVVGSVHKTHLFGREKYDFTRGENNRPIKAGGLKVGIPICFDTEYTDICRDLVRNGAQILLVPNHDPRFPNSIFNHLHSAIIPFRAAENGVPIVWSECNSLSVIVDETGRVVTRAPAEKVTSIVAAVHLNTRRTFFSFAGDYFMWISVAAVVLISASALIKKSPANRETHVV